MNTHPLIRSFLNLLQLFLQVNFNASVSFLLIASILSFTGSELIIASDQDVYGPLVNNMRFVMFYLCMIEISVYCLYRLRNGYASVLVFGVFLVLLVWSLDFYCKINQIEVDGNYQLIFLYVGLSHGLYGGMKVMREPSKKNDSTISCSSIQDND